jgi:FAD/FMN-containing dehydrogenase
MSRHPDRGPSRRAFVAGSLGGSAFAALRWRPSFRIAAASAAASDALPDFPATIPLYRQAFENWAREIQIDDLWTCAPHTPADVVTIANWAHARGYTVRPRGSMHNWSPLTIRPGEALDRVLLVDTTASLRAISVDAMSSPPTITAQGGALLGDILMALQLNNLGWTSVPAPGDITIAGALAVDAHGAALPAVNESALAGHSYGSLSHLVTSLTAVVWSAEQNQYVLRTFARAHSDSRALSTHLGRAFITSVTMQAGANYRLRCQSWFNIPNFELFGASGAVGRSFESHLAGAGRVEAIWFPFTSASWLKVWTLMPTKPLFARAVTGPYNFPFSDQVDPQMLSFLTQLLKGDTSGTPAFGGLMLTIVQTGLVLGGLWDLWGWSKDVLLYVRPSTLRVSEGGAAIITRRDQVQRVLHEFYEWYQARMSYYQARGLYPMNGPVEIRCSGLDQPVDVDVASSGSPQLSALRPLPTHPEWDTAVWIDALTIPNTPGSIDFYRDMEQWMLSHYASYALVRPEWSKGWAYSATAAWSNDDILHRVVPAAYSNGYLPDDNFETARATFNRHDPHRLFSNSFLDTLLP